MSNDHASIYRTQTCPLCSDKAEFELSQDFHCPRCGRRKSLFLQELDSHSSGLIFDKVVYLEDQVRVWKENYEELERQLAECQRERDMLRKFHHDQQELHERNEANAQTNRLRLLQIVELRAACQMALDALEGCINDPKMRHTDTVHYATQDAHAKLCEVLK